MLRTPAYGRLFFCETPAGTESGGSNPPATPAATTSPAATPPSTEASGEVTFTEAQQKAIDRLVGKARQEGRDAEKQANTTADEERQAEAARQAEIAKGNFEKVEADLKKERDGAKADRDSLKTSLDAANAIVSEQVEALKKDLPDELLTTFPTNGTPIDQLSYLKDRQTVFEAAKAAAGVAATNVTRLPATPKATSKPDGITKEQQAAVDRQYARW